MGELLNAVRHPDSYQEVGVHPVTKQKGRFAVRKGKRVQVWNQQARHYEWRTPVEVEELPERDDGSTVVVISSGEMGERDFAAISEEMAEQRGKRRRNKPLFAPRPNLIEEACKQVRIKAADEYTVGNQRFRRPEVGILIPRNADWAKRMALESQRIDL